MPKLNLGKGGGSKEKVYKAINSVRESDVLILSQEDLLSQQNGNRRNATDIKKIITPQWLKSNLMKPWVMLAYVEEKTKKGTAFLEIKVDKTKASFLKAATDKENQGYAKLYVYVVESLASSIREYRTLRMSEFYGHAPLILDPRKSLL